MNVQGYGESNQSPGSSQAPHSARFQVNSFVGGHVENLLSGYCRIEHQAKIISWAPNRGSGPQIICFSKQLRELP